MQITFNVAVLTHNAQCYTAASTIDSKPHKRVALRENLQRVFGLIKREISDDSAEKKKEKKQTFSPVSYTYDTIHHLIIIRLLL